MKKEIWIVAANSTEARFFKLVKGLHLEEFETFIHVESRMHERDLFDGFPGSYQHSTVGGKNGKAGVSGMISPHTDPKQAEIAQFAKRVADFLNRARAQGTLERLYVVASPTFLGLIRQELDHQTLQLIASAINKDIASFKPEEILKYFPIGTG